MKYQIFRLVLGLCLIVSIVTGDGEEHKGGKAVGLQGAIDVSENQPEVSSVANQKVDDKARRGSLSDKLKKFGDKCKSAKDTVMAYDRMLKNTSKPRIL